MKNNTIWKTTLALTDQQRIMIPEGAEMLCAKEQYGNICIWYTCNPDNLKVAYDILIVGTGGKAPISDWNHLDTVKIITPSGTYMWHVFVPKWKRP